MAIDTKRLEGRLKHEVRLCKYGELKLLQNFIIEHWSKNHIFAYSDNLLKWQHGDSRKKIINFVVAFNKESKEFDAILGFIPTSQYDSSLGNNDIWLAIWKVKAKYAKTGIGLQVFLFLNSKYKPSSIGAFGISNDTLKICKAFNYRTGVLKHFYIKNDNLTNYSIAKFTNQSTNNTHNVSATISLRDHEWDAAGEWMWDNKEYYNGLSVLPYDGGTYTQAPFEDIDEATYEKMMGALSNVDLSEIIETEDETDLKGELACAGGSCEIS